MKWYGAVNLREKKVVRRKASPTVKLTVIPKLMKFALTRIK